MYTPCYCFPKRIVRPSPATFTGASRYEQYGSSCTTQPLAAAQPTARPAQGVEEEGTVAVAQSRSRSRPAPKSDSDPDPEADCWNFSSAPPPISSEAAPRQLRPRANGARGSQRQRQLSPPPRSTAPALHQRRDPPSISNPPHLAGAGRPLRVCAPRG